MTTYDEDRSDKMINNNKLKAMFDMGSKPSNPPATTSVKDIVSQASDIKDDLKEQRESPDTIIYNTIDRANRMLDKIEEDIETGASARLYEVAATMINAVTTAANSIIGTGQYEEELLLKQKALELKERETAVKEALGQKGGSKTVNNMIVTDRESLLKMMKGENPQEEREVKEVN